LSTHRLFCNNSPSFLFRCGTILASFFKKQLWQIILPKIESPGLRRYTNKQTMQVDLQEMMRMPNLLVNWRKKTLRVMPNLHEGSAIHLKTMTTKPLETPQQSHDYKEEAQNVNDDSGRALNKEETGKARNKSNEGMRQGRDRT
jgi:hypothetical protein